MRYHHQHEEVPASDTLTHAPPRRCQLPLPDLPEFHDVQPCLRCGKLCHREHFGVEDCRNRGCIITLVFCTHCDIGFETLWGVRNGWWRRDFTLEHKGHKLAPFLARLESLICVDA